MLDYVGILEIVIFYIFKYVERWLVAQLLASAAHYVLKKLLRKL